MTPPFPPRSPLDQRRSDLARLADESWDVVIVGGGIVGSGALLDAASRGLKAALIERSDIAAGTSSRSSRLIHGG
ncbi:MAG TPA: FAD-dependent oxidoreductase, partial [Candidatus Saccharimonadales bacterium]|nr:FAD-dependent oxidoreductase [Candidatus Saccharimonadales bacterium]